MHITANPANQGASTSCHITLHVSVQRKGTGTDMSQDEMERSEVHRG